MTMKFCAVVSCGSGSGHVITVKSASIDIIMTADIDGNDFAGLNQKFQGDPITDVDRNRVEPAESTF
jgi:hypothetical protein